MPQRTTRSPLTLLAALALLLAIFAMAGCGKEEDLGELVEGEAFEVGELEYNVIFSRYLNPGDNEDSAYLVGQGPSAPDGLYFGVFVKVKNHSDEEIALPISYTIEDSFGEEFESIPSESLFALPLGEIIEPEGNFPTEDSTAQTGPIEGSLILFEIPQRITENRPLELVIPGEEENAFVELDL